MTLVVSQKSVKFFKKNKDFVYTLNNGHYIIDILFRGLNFRRQYFEGEEPMGYTADITDIVYRKSKKPRDEA